VQERLGHAGDEDDAVLMRRVASGDGRALETLSERYTPMLFAIAWRMLADAAEAEDVVQEAITRLWTHAERWTPVGGGLGGWLRRVATNLCLDRKRRRAFISDDAVPERTDETAPADAMIDAGRRERAIAAAMLALPERQRAAIVLTYYEGVSNAEAASALGVGVKALESLLVRARRGLARSLAASGLLQEGSAA
jgi:RNA polymerase sigma-70 factor (ECF subfamily)